MEPLVVTIRLTPFLRYPVTGRNVEDGKLLMEITLPLVSLIIILVGSFLVGSGWKGFLFKLCQDKRDFRRDRVLSFQKVSSNKYILR